MIRWVGRQVEVLGRHSDRAWYLPAISALAGFDLFVAIVPTDALVISSVLLRPKRWLSTAFWITTGSAVGATALALLTGLYGERLIEFLLPGAMATPRWAEVAGFLQRHGWGGLAFIAGGPLPQQPAVAACALAKMSLLSVFSSVWVGRGIKYGFFAWSATHAPRVLLWIKRGRKK